MLAKEQKRSDAGPEARMISIMPALLKKRPASKQ
ncbi:hypothetical protein BSS2_II0227 [Brucella suis bv. 1 str. S2]|uniref:Uncharacterized protein n=2 Tax=Brucella TaxID=234 RepID=Q576W0_BRUAB|nr:hypothetical protein BRA0241 [Brucella suis 1330]AAX76324.1 hypothetical protein BruAb2_0938 [Brucella abortus bv. 1 str. 9-941]AEU07391.1 hypothetical protein BSVBI22_B0237 [Brucella suis VBI22]AHN47991.1 hypothetical protein BSS2_II0227 [Brucella suis bv. 1 str. S2]CDL77789.1 unnamed protein product [Brucella canis str. Oliveri]